MNWIQDCLPHLKLSISNGFMWRSDLVFVYHEVQGCIQADLRANEGKTEMWWIPRYPTPQVRWELGEVCGWIPRSALPDRPEKRATWQAEEDHPAE